MSDICRVEVICPSCSHQQEITEYRSVNVTLNPELKSRLLEQELTRHQCTQCKMMVTLNNELLYHDMNKKLMVQVIHSDEPRRDRMPALADYQFRKVSSIQQMVEKVCVFESGLDDRVVETLKDALYHTLCARYAPTLAKMGSWPLDPTNLLFFQKSTFKINVEHEPSGPIESEQIMFLLLLPVPHSMCAMCIATPMSAYVQSQDKLKGKLDAAMAGDRWQRIDSRWAEQTIGTDVTPVDTQLMLSPEMLESSPIVKSICKIHGEEVQAALDAAKQKQGIGIFGRMKRWLGR